ncbi:hypothetical protein T484DRAFT_1861191 [Baffinella frigidus]|nr:hypothetical protein T484DRAFT_1861191 [Cryptophyta sp. CCMP2293]
MPQLLRTWHYFVTGKVTYRGHNYPVWDVCFSALGHYFVTASHDRTARLWSTDHIYPLRLFAGAPLCDRTARLWSTDHIYPLRLFLGAPPRAPF